MSDNPITEAICNVMAEAGAVEKRGRNDFHRYDYATAADIAHKLQPLMAKHGLIIFQNEMGRDLVSNETVMMVEYEFKLAHRSGRVMDDRFQFTGVAAARNTKGGFDDKCINKCHTAARKYFMLALFQIPTGDYDDADAQEDRPAPAATVQPAAAPRKPPEPPSKDEVDQRKAYTELANGIKTAPDLDTLREWWRFTAEKRQTLPQAGQDRLNELFDARVDELAPFPGDDDEPPEARYLRAG